MFKIKSSYGCSLIQVTLECIIGKERKYIPESTKINLLQFQWIRVPKEPCRNFAKNWRHGVEWARISLNRNSLMLPPLGD